MLYDDFRKKSSKITKNNFYTYKITVIQKVVSDDMLQSDIRIDHEIGGPFRHEKFLTTLTKRRILRLILVCRT